MSPHPSLPPSDDDSALSDTTDDPPTPLAPALPFPAPTPATEWQAAELDFLSAGSDDDSSHRTPTPAMATVVRVWPDPGRLAQPVHLPRLSPAPFPQGAPLWLPLGLAAYADDSPVPSAPPPPHPVPPPSPLASPSLCSSPDDPTVPPVFQVWPLVHGTVVTPRPDVPFVGACGPEMYDAFARHITRYRPSAALRHCSPCPTISCPSLASDESLVEDDWPVGAPLPRTAAAPFDCPEAIPQPCPVPTRPALRLYPTVDNRTDSSWFHGWRSGLAPGQLYSLWPTGPGPRSVREAIEAGFPSGLANDLFGPAPSPTVTRYEAWTLLQRPPDEFLPLRRALHAMLCPHIPDPPAAPALHPLIPPGVLFEPPVYQYVPPISPACPAQPMPPAASNTPSEDLNSLFWP